MTDIQSRISNLEHVFPPDRTLDTPQGSRFAEYRHPALRPAGHAAQGYHRPPALRRTTAQDYDAPMYARKYLKTPRRFSGFDFNFDSLKQKLDTPPTTPEAIRLPRLVSASTTDERPRIDAFWEQGLTFRDPLSPTEDFVSMINNDGSDIVEQIVEFDVVHIPMPPLLQTPPRSLRSKAASLVSREDDITALPDVPPPISPEYNNMQCCYNGLRSWSACKAILKKRMTGGR